MDIAKSAPNDDMESHPILSPLQIMEELIEQYPHTTLFSQGSYHLDIDGKKRNFTISDTFFVRPSKKHPEKEDRIELLEHQKKIGSGSFGSVFSSKTLVKKEQYLTGYAKKNRVVKAITRRPKEPLADFKLRVEREYNLAALVGYLKPKPIQYSPDQQAAYLTMAKLGNYSLAELLASKKKLSYKQRCILCTNLIRTLIDLQEKGIIHRDLKAENIRISADLSVHIIDFGLAITDKEAALYTTAVGAPYYRAPELFNKKASYSQASDNFALGLILAEIWGNNALDHISTKQARDLAYMQERNTLHPLKGKFEYLQKTDGNIRKKIKYLLHELTKEERSIKLAKIAEDFSLLASMPEKYHQDSLSFKKINSFFHRNHKILSQTLIDTANDIGLVVQKVMKKG